MLDLLTIFRFSDLLLLAAFAVSLVLACKFALQLLFGSQHTRQWMALIFGMAAIVVIGILVVDGIRWADAETPTNLAPVIGLTIIAVGMISAWIQWRGVALRLPAVQMRRRTLAWTLLVTTAALAGWSSYRFQLVMQPLAAEFPQVLARPVHMERESHFVGISDKGREIVLYRSHAPLVPKAEMYPVAGDPRHGLRSTVIERGDPDNTSNCHGWVFTGGEFLLDLQGIKTILQDNGYERCTSPQAGDVIVYYASGDVPAHTGVVSGVLADGTVIIESKWGIDGRFLHCPLDQPYSEAFAYFRTSRGSNQIDIRELPIDSLAKERLPRRRIKRA